MFKFLSTILRNKIFLYVGTRYVTYALQFIASFYIALKLGPVGFGVWSFILLLINFYNIIDFGISNSINILLVQDREVEERSSSHILSSIIITIGLNILVILSFIIIKYAHFGFLLKYDIGIYLPAILYTIIVWNFNKVFSSIYRVKNRLLELAFFQSIIPILFFLAVIFSPVNTLWYLLGAYMLGQSLAFAVFILRKQITIKGAISCSSMNTVFFKGFWLFLYNGAFYLIMFSTSSFVSAYYSVSDYGKFSFAYTLAHAILLFLEAFGYIVFPKIIQKLKGNNFEECKSVILMIRNSYLMVVHGLVYLAFPAFYLLCLLMPKYGDIQRMLCVAALTILPYANAFGLNTFLMAQNKERRISCISCISLIVNIGLLFLFISVFNFSYDLILVATLVSYVLFTYQCALYTLKVMGEPFKFLKVLEMAFPVRISVPYLFTLVATYFFSERGHFIWLLLPLIVFLLMNRTSLGKTAAMIVQLVKRPEIIDLK